MKKLGPGSTPRERLQAVGLRATAPRLSILAHLERDRSHPSAEDVHAALSPAHPSLSLSTVYTTLETFVERGLLRRVRTGGGRLRVDGTVHDHDHAICRGCGAVQDIDRPPGAHARLPEPELPAGTRLVEIRVEYDVLCSVCGAEESPA